MRKSWLRKPAVFPTPVGMDRGSSVDRHRSRRFPHTRGDGPYTAMTAGEIAQFSPHPREPSRSAPVAPPAGAWIEISYVCNPSETYRVAPPAGAWIEIGSRSALGPESWVAPPAGAWIEICCFAHLCGLDESLPLRERGLKFGLPIGQQVRHLSLPLRERGLKSRWGRAQPAPSVAPPAGAWIEIPAVARPEANRSVAPPAGAWIEIPPNWSVKWPGWPVAPPAGAWIEMRNGPRICQTP